MTPGTLAATATSAGMIAQQVAGKAVRDSLYLTRFDVRSLPIAMGLAAVLSLIAVLTLGRLMTRFGPRRMMPILFGVSGVGLLVEWLAHYASVSATAVAVYFHTSVFGPVVISTFWSLINERFDPHTARAAVARIAAGGTLGGVIGGVAAWRAASVLSLPTAVCLLAVINLLCVIGTFGIHLRPVAGAAPESRPSLPQEAEGAISPLGVLRKAPFLRNLALLVAIGSVISSLLDYVFSAQATATFGKGETLFAFFSLFGLAVSVLSLLFQLALGRVAMERLGLAVNIAVLPGIIILGGAAGLAVPGLLSSALLRGAELVQRNTLFRSAYELLYTPLPKASKRSTKALIDVAFDRLGTVLGSAIAMLAIYAFVRSQSILLGAVVVFAIATLPIARQLHIGYVAALEEQLRAGAKQLDLPPLSDRGSLPIDDQLRDKLIQRVEKLRSHDDTNGPAHQAILHAPVLVGKLKDLLSHDVARARRVLVALSEQDRWLAGAAIVLLAHDALHVDAREALRKLAPSVTGELVDALVDARVDFIVRRRVPRILSSCRTQRAADGLLIGLDDERFEVRFACGRALLKITEANDAIVVPRDRVIETALREVARVAPEVAEYEDDANEATESNALVDVILRERVSRNVEHIFTLVALLVDREPLRMAFRALHQADDRHRGTALEYLQTTLPTELRDALWPLISEAGPLPMARSAAEVLGDLARAMKVEQAKQQ